MEPYIKEATDETPLVKLDPSTGEFEISGKSLPEDVSKVYDPLISWLDHLSGYKEAIQFDIKFKYFNTASSKKLLDLLYKLEEIHDEQENVLIRWYFPIDDEDMEDAGYEYSDLIEVPFEMIEVDDE